MGRLNTFEIFLSNQYGEVDAGSTLQGQVVLECSEDMEVKEVVVQCFGKCRVQWVDTRAAAPLAEVQAGITPPVTAEESYINDFFTCFPKREEGLPNRAANTRLPKGMHTFDFAFPIPSSAPPSFIADHGFIKYIVRAQVHLANKVESNVRYFTVRPVFDLNRVSNIEEEVEKKDELEVNSLLRHWGKCRAKISIPKRGYVHGDSVPVTVMINNESNKELNKARLRLRMVTRYSIKSQTCVADRILAESRLAPITAGYTFNSCDRCLRIPRDVPASHLHGCKFMHVKYYVELFLRPTLLSVKKMKISIKIHIGTIPVSVAREQAYLRMREAPPRYDELPPSYRDAIRLHLVKVQLNSSESDQNSAALTQASLSEQLPGHSDLPHQCQNCRQNHLECGASCSSNNIAADQCQNAPHHNQTECEASCSNNDNNGNNDSSDMECLCSSVDSLISMDDAENVKPREGSGKSVVRARRPPNRRSGEPSLTLGTEDLRITVIRRNIARAPREELPLIEPDEAVEDCQGTPPRSTSKKSLASVLNSFFTSFPFIVCHDRNP